MSIIPLWQNQRRTSCKTQHALTISISSHLCAPLPYATIDPYPHQVHFDRPQLPHTHQRQDDALPKGDEAKASGSTASLTFSNQLQDGESMVITQGDMVRSDGASGPRKQRASASSSTGADDQNQCLPPHLSVLMSRARPHESHSTRPGDASTEQMRAPMAWNYAIQSDSECMEWAHTDAVQLHPFQQPLLYTEAHGRFFLTVNLSSMCLPQS